MDKKPDKDVRRYNTFNKGSKQRAINGGKDQYYTRPEVALEFMKVVKEKIYGFKYSNIIEPSAGAGSFIDAGKECGLKISGYDIDPQRTDIIEKDFFDLELPKHCIVVGNPPFGFMANLAIDFFNHAAKSADVIAFIVPKVFRKESVTNKLHLNFHKIKDIDVPQKAFILDGEYYSVPCVFQIWWRWKTERIIRNKKEILNQLGKYILFVDKDKANFAIRRAGSKAGQILNGTDHSPTSTYFCKGIYPRIKEIINGIDFTEVVNNTTGVRSLSKIELFDEIEKRIK